MPEKTPRELLRETLDRNAEQVKALPAWLRASISTQNIFKVAPAGTRREDDRDAAQAERTRG
ncbi:hypothetical protein [Enhygromyxa salina]|uniref:hypothetical protein n=1 Tax=Enhygromyxa salina TaxID=215803 RepID=UPI000D046A74|nr:hypothetical protein [Enhygromyxa salina]